MPPLTTSSTASGSTTSVADYEQREIIYARGLDFNHGDPTMDDSWQVPEALNDRLGGTLQNAGANTWTYRNDAQEVDYTVRVVNTRRAFKDALETEGAMVVYGGHSRYGRNAPARGRILNNYPSNNLFPGSPTPRLSCRSFATGNRFCDRRDRGDR
jgi:hypothetical protein